MSLFQKQPLIRRADLAVLLGVIVSVLLANIAAFGQECVTLRGEIVRLHIMANSDSRADQQVKLRVRDRILSEVGEVFAAPQTQSDAKRIAQENLQAIQHAAEQELVLCKIDEPVKVELCNMYFSTRQYDTLSLPAGNYDAVRVTIGAGAGKNWWCVMYPPICVPAAISEEMPEVAEIQALNSEPLFRPKLAVIELVEQIFQE